MTDKTLANLPDIGPAGQVEDDDLAYIVRPGAQEDYKTTLDTLRTYIHTGNPQIVATHTAIPAGYVSGNSNSRADTVNIERNAVYIGREDVTNIQFGMAGFYITSGSGMETDIANSFTWETSLELGDPIVSQRYWFNGSNLITVDGGAPLVLTNPLGYDVPAGAIIYPRQRKVIADPSMHFPSSAFRTNAQQSLRRPDGGTSAVDGSTGPLSTSGSYSSGGAPPTVILGVPRKPMASVIFVGDSIGNGVGDFANQTARGANGFMSRGLELVNGYSIPWHKQAVGGHSAAQAVAPNSWRQRVYWKYATHLVCQLGTNDIASGPTLEVLQQRLLKIWTSAKRTIGPYGKPLNVSQCTIIPRMSGSSDGYTSSAGMTIGSYFANDGLRGQINAWIKAQVGQGLLDSVIDVNAVMEDPQAPGKFVTPNGTSVTSDGVHPNQAGHILMGEAVNAWAQTIKP